MNFIGYEVTLQYKGGAITLRDQMPDLELKEDGEIKDFITQYFGIWRFMAGKVKEMNAKKILEFGTREGYSTRMFSWMLEETGGTIYTVDKDQPKNRELLEKPNIVVMTEDVMELDWRSEVDIIYIDDWHDPLHLYYELNRFAKLARVVMLHDVSIELGQPKDLMKVINEWCKQNMAIVTYYPMNSCGLAIIEIEESKKCFG